MATTTTEILTLKLKQPSDRLKEAIVSCASGFKRLRDSIEDTLSIGRAEGFTDIQIGRMIKEEMMKNHYSIRTVQMYLPASAKMKPRGQIAATSTTTTTISANNALNPNPISEKSALNFDKLNVKELTHEDLKKMSKQQLIQIIQVFQSLEFKSKSKSKSKPNPSKFKFERKIPQHIIQQVTGLHKEGKSSREISKTVGIGKTSVLRILSRQTITNKT